MINEIKIEFLSFNFIRYFNLYFYHINSLVKKYKFFFNRKKKIKI